MIRWADDPARETEPALHLDYLLARPRSTAWKPAWIGVMAWLLIAVWVGRNPDMADAEIGDTRMLGLVLLLVAMVALLAVAAVRAVMTPRYVRELRSTAMRLVDVLDVDVHKAYDYSRQIAPRTVKEMELVQEAARVLATRYDDWRTSHELLMRLRDFELVLSRLPTAGPRSE